MPQHVQTRAELDEARRLAALNVLALLDEAPQKEFDALVALTASLLSAPDAMLTLIDKDRQWVKAQTGNAPNGVPRELTLCDHTIRGTEPLVIEDTRADPRFADSPWVTAAEGVRFYAGVPIHARDPDGKMQPIGALCVTDRSPRRLSPTEYGTLLHVATLAEAMIAARATALKAIDIARQAEHLATYLAEQDRTFRQAERIAMIGSWRLSLVDESVEWSDGVSRIHGLPPGQVPTLSQALDFYPVEARARISAKLARTIESGEPFDFEEDFLTATGNLRRVRSQAQVEYGGGKPIALIGVFQDITDRHALETALRRTADTDALTSLANRAAFDRELESAIARAKRDNTPLMMLIVDLDGFKAINDTFGHMAGDDVLRSVGNALRASWLRGSFAARLGGDEFAVLIEHPELIEWPAMVGERLEVSLRQTVQIGTETLATAGTVGWAILDEHCTTARDFVHRVDSIMYAAKRARTGDPVAGDRRARGRRAGDSPGDAPPRRGPPPLEGAFRSDGEPVPERDGDRLTRRRSAA